MFVVAPAGLGFEENYCCLLIGQNHFDIKRRRERRKINIKFVFRTAREPTTGTSPAAPYRDILLSQTTVRSVGLSVSPSTSTIIVIVVL